ncbi:unnamed protein product [Adineta ricciae]|uniref:Uncharacterized protein n=1 Tax=Adineta ricciae TaxID=249248 RepID=A0A814UIN9_ADIRI|nr:unnamed protein product [Adineta ricciae]
MSNSDKERTERRRRRRHTQSARTVASSEPPDTKRYTKLLEERLRKAKYVNNEPVVAMQTRHVNNRQHAIPFAQQFVDQLLEECEYINRRIVADRRKEAEQTDKEKARLYRQVEATHAKKVRELELYNRQSFIKGLVDEHLKESTPQAQLRRIEQLEKSYKELKQEHDTLLGRVRQCEEKHGDDKSRLDEDISKLDNQFNQYHIELNKYKNKVDKTNAELDEKITEISEQQQQHTIFIQNLSLQQNTLEQLSQYIEQIVNDRHSDLNKLEIFARRLDNVKDQLDEIHQALSLLNQIPSLNQDLIEIRNLLIQPNVMKDLSLRLDQTQNDIVGHANKLDQLSQELNQTINWINTNNSTEVLQQLQLIKEELKLKSSQIDQSNTLTTNILEQIYQLQNSLTNITEEYANFQKKLAEMEINDQNVINQLVTNFVKANMTQFVEEQNQLRNKLQDLIDKQQQLSNLISDLESLRSSKSTDEQDQHNSNQFDPEILNTFLENTKIETQNLLSTLSQQLNEEIKHANIFINDLKLRFDQFLKSQKTASPSVNKRIPYIESLAPLDLLDDTWN